MKSYGRSQSSCECSRCDPNGRDRKRRKTGARRDGRGEIDRQMPRGQMKHLTVFDDFSGWDVDDSGGAR